jgi:hypothetical protein
LHTGLAVFGRHRGCGVLLQLVLKMSTLNLSQADQEFLTSPEALLQQFATANDPAHHLDFLTYRIYLDPPLSSSSPSDPDENNLQRALKFKDIISEYLTEKMNGYLWHKDIFQLKVILDPNKSDLKSIYLGGILEFGDNIEDEWFVVWLLFEISRQFPILSISVTDMDGEFLLIESAAHIPDWLGPENSENRVWIRNGKVYIIPLDEPGRSRNGSMQLNHALQFLRSSRCRANKGILKCLMARLAAFPASGLANQHKSTCLVPSKIAQLLTIDPQLIAVAVNTLCSAERNKFYSKTMKAMEYFGVEDPVPISVTFTRAQYAQFTFLQRFHIPQKFQQTQSRIQQQGSAAGGGGGGMEWSSQVAKSFDLGCRITCGLELAYQLSKLNQQSFHEMVEESNAKKIATLSQMGFDHQRLASSESFSLLNEMVCVNGTLTADRIRSQFEADDSGFGEISGRQFNDSLSSIATFLETFKDSIPLFEKFDGLLSEEGEAVNVNYSSIAESESDDWLHLTPEEFEKNLEDRIAQIQQQQQEEILPEEKKKNSSEQQQQPQEMPTQTKSAPVESVAAPEASKPPPRKPVNTLYNKPPPSIPPTASASAATAAEGRVGDYDSDDDSMISNIWKPKQGTGSKGQQRSTQQESKVNEEQDESSDVLESIVRGMDIFLKTYSDYSGVEDPNPNEETDEINLESLHLSETNGGKEDLPVSAAASASPQKNVNQGLKFDPTKLMSLLSAEETKTTVANGEKDLSENSLRMKLTASNDPSSSSSSPRQTEKETGRVTLDQPTFKSTEESMRKSNVISLQSSTPLPSKPFLGTPSSIAAKHPRDRGGADLSSRFPSSQLGTPQTKAGSTSPRAVQTPIQPHKLSVSFDTDTSVLSGVAYAMTPPRSRRSPPRLPTVSTPHPSLRVMSDEEDSEVGEEEEDDLADEEEEDEESEGDSDDEVSEGHDDQEGEDNEEYMKEYMVRLSLSPSLCHRFV